MDPSGVNQVCFWNTYRAVQERISRVTPPKMVESSLAMSHARHDKCVWKQRKSKCSMKKAEHFFLMSRCT